MCSEEGCDRTVHRRGLCSPHYQRLMYRTRNERPVRRTCDQCGDRHYAKGLCKKHYWEMRAASGDGCSCGRAMYANGLCRSCYLKKWRQDHPEQAEYLYHLKRARRLGAAVLTLTAQDWQEIKEEQNGQCFYCQRETVLQMEHKIPLSRGGQHTRENVVGACGPCNMRKKTLTAEEFAEKMAAAAAVV